MSSPTKQQIKNFDTNWRKLDKWVSNNFKEGYGTRTSISFTDTEMLIHSTFCGMNHRSELLATYQKPDFFADDFNPENLKLSNGNEQ